MITKYHRLNNLQQIKFSLALSLEGEGVQDQAATSGETLLEGRDSAVRPEVVQDVSEKMQPSSGVSPFSYKAIVPLD